MAQKLFLRRLRDLGEKISDSLLFIKTNWKNLFLLYAIFVVPFIIVAGIVGVLFASRIYSNLAGSADVFKITDFFSIELAVIVLCLLMSGVSYQASVYSYMRLYEENKGQQPTIAQVGQVFSKKAVKIFFYSIGMSILIAICIFLPALLVAVVPIVSVFILLFTIMFAVMFFLHVNCVYVMEDGDFSKGFFRLLELLRNRWWHCMGYTFIILLIYYVFGFIVQILFSLLGVFSINFLDPVPFEGAESKAAVTTMILGFGSLMLINQLFYLIVFSGIGVNYFSLVEEKDGSAIEEQIEAIGTNNDKYGGIEEEY